jgi:hypothetical protein
MPTKQLTKDERNANLDALKKALDEWSKKEKARLENEIKYMRAVLKGHGSTSTGTQNLAKTASLLQVEIDQFIVGG